MVEEPINIRIEKLKQEAKRLQREREQSRLTNKLSKQIFKPQPQRITIKKGLYQRLKERGERLQAKQKRRYARRLAIRQEKIKDRREKYAKSEFAGIAGRIQRGTQRFARQTPSQQQRFFKARAKALRGIQTAFPTGRIVRDRTPKGQRRAGRPKGTFKYFIPGRGIVDVFTYRKWLSQQRNMAEQQFRQRFARQKAFQEAAEEYPVASQQFRQPYQFQQPVQSTLYQPTQQYVQPVQPSLKEISVLERTPLTLGMESQETFMEKDLFTGQPKIKRRGFLL